MGQEASAEVDLRGLRVDELDLRLGRALDAALISGLPSFRIIHGKGMGALRARVQELLRDDPRIASFRPGDRFEGGTGVTIAEFKPRANRKIRKVQSGLEPEEAALLKLFKNGA